MVSKKQINLLPVTGLNASNLGKIIIWFVNIGRFIVIGTELVVILAFITRFKFDTDLVNLNEEIVQKQTKLDTFGSLENKVRFLQGKINLIKKLEASAPATDKILNLISGLVPADVYLDTLSFSKDQFNAKAISLSPTGVALFMQNLQKSDQFTQINLTSLKTGGLSNPKIEFTIQVSIK